MIDWMHPALFLVVGVLFLPLLPAKIKKIYLVALPALALIDILLMTPGTYGAYHFLGVDLVFGRVDKLSLVFAVIFSIMALIGSIYSLETKEDGHHIAAFTYAGGSLGATFAGDLITLFMFLELMTVGSVFLIWYRRTPEAIKAGYRYILIHAIGGVLLLGGIVIHFVKTGSTDFTLLGAGAPGFNLILIGFLINGAVPPLHAWLPDAYPEATVPGAVFLSAFTTKTAVYCLIRGFAGTEMLVWLGVVMAVYGVLYAMLSNDIRRLLAYHIVSQVGYMVCGIGIGTELAINGAVAHAFAHILYKSLLFMGAGSVLYMTGKSKMTELGGIYKKMPITLVLYMVAAFSIAGMPLFSGFVSKTMVIASAGEDGRTLIWLLLVLTSTGTFLSTGLKLPYVTFYGESKSEECKLAKDPPVSMLIAMGIGAALCFLIGIYPHMLYDMLPYAVHFHPFSAEHIVGEFELLLFAGVGYLIYRKSLVGHPVISLDTDWLYRKGNKIFFWFAANPVSIYEDHVTRLYRTIVIRSTRAVADMGYWFDQNIIDGMVNGVARMVVAWASKASALQSGHIQQYAMAMAFGVAVILGIGFFL
jgi:multicomponent Na+:H+ antiporter subunit D